jgi:hypothetical protein
MPRRRIPARRRQEERMDASPLGSSTARTSLDSEWRWQQLYRAAAIEPALQARQEPLLIDNMPPMTPDEIKRWLYVLMQDDNRRVPPGTLARWLGIHPPTLRKIALGRERASKRVCAVLSPVLRKIERGLVVVKKSRGGRAGGSSFELEYRSPPKADPAAIPCAPAQGVRPPGVSTPSGGVRAPSIPFGSRRLGPVRV